MPYKDPEKAKAYKREYRRKTYQADPVAGAAAAREWRQKNLDRAREIARDNWNRHKEQYKEQQYAHIAEHREEVRNRQRIWWEANKHRYAGRKKDNRASEQKRRAQKNGQTEGPHFTIPQFKELCVWFGGVCLSCGEAKALTADHVVPLSQGGDNGIRNIQPLCRGCNSKKGTQQTDYRDPDTLEMFLLYDAQAH